MQTIEQLREHLQNIDLDIIKNLALRQGLCIKIAQIKKESGQQIIDLEQEKRSFEFYESLSNEYAVDPQFVLCLFRLIIINSRTIQQEICQFD